MATLTHAERLDMVKTFLRAGGDAQDATLELIIDEAIEFLISSGVSKEVAESRKALGAIVMYVNDTDNYQPGAIKLSDALIKRTIQLCSEV